MTENDAIEARFKPQRGKFTLKIVKRRTIDEIVSNPNGVNLHYRSSGIRGARSLVSNPNGVNLHLRLQSFHPRQRSVSNPNGVNLHKLISVHKKLLKKFQTPTG